MQTDEGHVLPHVLPMEEPWINLYDLSYPALVELMADWGQPRYRADQLWQWLYKHLATGFDEMTNLPKALRERLAQETRLGSFTQQAEMTSADGQTRKFLLQAADGESIEVVLMRYRRRRTACISTQAGCGMGCVFCATGQMGLRRNLTSGEIVEQVILIARHLAAQGDRLTNVVLMGMGEPLANYKATLQAIRRLINPHGFAFGQRRITLSTVGLVPGIRRFSREGLQVGLAVSLHAATDELRDQIVPINRRYPLDPLMAACRDYVTRTGRRITFEWAMIHGLNDTETQALALVERVRGLLCHVNLIPLNPTEEYEGRPSSPERIAAFQAILERHGIPSTVRTRRGIDIQAGCGQLRQRVLQQRG